MATGSPLDKPDFDLYADQTGRIIGSLSAILVITTLSVALRLLSRKLARAGFWWDDHFAVIAWVSDLVPFILWFVALKYGFGRHIYIYGPVDGPKNARQYLKILYVFELAFHTTTTLAKYSILAFYYRIFPVPAFRRICIWMAVVCTLYMIAVDLTIIFQCQPIHYAWDQALGTVKGHCINEDAFFVGSGSCNAFLNLIVFIMPIPLLWRLRTTAKQQIILSIIFTIAGFVLLVSIIWIVVLAKLDSGDPTWNFVNSGIWSALEPSMAVVCACIPSLRPLYSVAVGAYENMTSVTRSKMSTTMSTTAGRKRGSWRPGLSRSQPSDGMFSQLEEQGDSDTKPFGHGVTIGRGEDDGGMELPLRGIQVKTEVLISSEKLEYKDRLF